MKLSNKETKIFLHILFYISLFFVSPVIEGQLERSLKEEYRPVVIGIFSVIPLLLFTIFSSKDTQFFAKLGIVVAICTLQIALIKGRLEKP